MKAKYLESYGLWENYGLYRSTVLSTAKLPKKVRVVIHRNPYKKAGDNRPDFQMMFVEGDSDKAVEVQMAKSEKAMYDRYIEYL